MPVHVGREIKIGHSFEIRKNKSRCDFQTGISISACTDRVASQTAVQVYKLYERLAHVFCNYTSTSGTRAVCLAQSLLCRFIFIIIITENSSSHTSNVSSVGSLAPIFFSLTVYFLPLFVHFSNLLYLLRNLRQELPCFPLYNFSPIFKRKYKVNRQVLHAYKIKKNYFSLFNMLKKYWDD